MRLLIRNIKGLVQVENNPKLRILGKEMSVINTISDAYLFIEDGLISDFGTMNEYNDNRKIPLSEESEVIDASGKFVFPSFCDSHTHLVFAGSREAEFTDKIRGLSYEEIAERGGGILNSVRKLRETSENDLYSQSMSRVNEIIHLGTGAVEIKSGYGLTVDDELKMLRVIRRISESSPD
jgi:imidazolonepropionase